MTCVLVDGMISPFPGFARLSTAPWGTGGRGSTLPKLPKSFGPVQCAGPVPTTSEPESARVGLAPPGAKSTTRATRPTVSASAAPTLDLLLGGMGTPLCL